jgi:predicted TIM-barrel fold metal-dependent hydrolase
VARAPGCPGAVGEGKFWAKLSGAYRLAATAPDYREAQPFHDALLAANSNNLVWGSDWPHPRPEGPVPDARHLLELFLAWTPDSDKQRAVLAENPGRLYDFP